MTLHVTGQINWRGKLLGAWTNTIKIVKKNAKMSETPTLLNKITTITHARQKLIET